MEKKNRPLQAANSDIRVSDITPLTKSLQAPKRTPKKHRAWICPYISRHLLSLNPLQARCRRYSRGER